MTHQDQTSTVFPLCSQNRECSAKTHSIPGGNGVGGNTVSGNTVDSREHSHGNTVRILAIDPGNEQSAYLLIGADQRPIRFGIHDNHDLLRMLREELWGGADLHLELAVEMIASYGMPVGREVFETCVWIGRFVQAWGGPHALVYRREVKSHLCHDSKAKDGNIRQALIDRFGGKDKAIGLKKTPGPLYGVKEDVWSALAIAVTRQETR